MPHAVVSDSSSPDGPVGFEVIGSLAAGATSMVYLAQSTGKPAGALAEPATGVRAGRTTDGQVGRPDGLVALKRPLPTLAGSAAARSRRVSGTTTLGATARGSNEAGQESSGASHEGLMTRARDEFEREARMGKTLYSPHLVGVMASGEDALGPYVALEFVEGASLLRLQSVDREGRSVFTPLPVAVAVRIVIDLLYGLEALHAEREDPEPHALIHGDVWPGNLLVGIDGRTRLGDFGAVCRSGQALSLEERRCTPGYESPESIRGETVSAASDVFAAGAVLWELLAGRRLFAAPTPQMIARQVLGGYVPNLLSVSPMAPKAVTAACEKALCRNPEGRHGSAREFRYVLEASMEKIFGGVRHEAVATFLRRRCGPMLESLRTMVGAAAAGNRISSGLRARQDA